MSRTDHLCNVNKFKNGTYMCLTSGDFTYLFDNNKRNQTIIYRCLYYPWCRETDTAEDDDEEDDDEEYDDND
mgnify:CR=1 FL=1